MVLGGAVSDERTKARALAVHGLDPVFVVYETVFGQVADGLLNHGPAGRRIKIEGFSLVSTFIFKRAGRSSGQFDGSRHGGTPLAIPFGTVSPQVTRSKF